MGYLILVLTKLDSVLLTLFMRLSNTLSRVLLYLLSANLISFVMDYFCKWVFSLSLL